MATYIELLEANGDTTLLSKVRMAVVVSATNIMAEDVATELHAQRLLWAKTVFSDPSAAALKMMWPVLAQNRAAAIAVILAADDATVQGAVDSAVNVFANGAA